jgi:hypothetical protein
MYSGSNGNIIQGVASGLPPVVSLSAVSAVGAGSVLDALVLRPNAAMSVTLSATATAGTVALEASLDGINFYSVGSPVSPTTAGTTVATSTSAFGRFFRAAVTTAIAGSGSPTVTVSVGAGG